MNKELKQTFLQRRYINDQQAHEKMLSIISIREMQVKTTVSWALVVHACNLRYLRGRDQEVSDDKDDGLRPAQTKSS
jgi:hypothetical protein